MAVLEQAVEVYAMEFERFMKFIRYCNACVHVAYTLIICF